MLKNSVQKVIKSVRNFLQRRKLNDTVNFSCISLDLNKKFSKF